MLRCFKSNTGNLGNVNPPSQENLLITSDSVYAFDLSY